MVRSQNLSEILTKPSPADWKSQGSANTSLGMASHAPKLVVFTYTHRLVSISHHDAIRRTRDERVGPDRYRRALGRSESLCGPCDDVCISGVRRSFHLQISTTRPR